MPSCKYSIDPRGVETGSDGTRRFTIPQKARRYGLAFYHTEPVAGGGGGGRQKGALTRRRPAKSQTRRSRRRESRR